MHCPRFWILKAFLPQMIKDHIVTVLSVMGLVGEDSTNAEDQMARQEQKRCRGKFPREGKKNDCRTVKVAHKFGRKKGQLILPSAATTMLLRSRRTPPADYTASKAALINLHESLRYELDKRSDLSISKRGSLSENFSLGQFGGCTKVAVSKASLSSAAWYKFLVPSLPPHVVAKAVIAALDEEESRIIWRCPEEGSPPSQEQTKDD
ncbi:hypothetical protein JB92DRAFT_2831489 [Gautieria morchelliformis]|nr:hypothetical protein JB92DRAFT_2831489 [Gautieria morchelliformis]